MTKDRIFFVDRRDQAEWLVGESWPSFKVNVKGKKPEIFNWLNESSAGRVVVSGDGVLPDEKSPYKIWSTFDEIQKCIYTIFFEDDTSATMFKLAWGGSI